MGLYEDTLVGLYKDILVGLYEDIWWAYMRIFGGLI